VSPSLFSQSPGYFNWPAIIDLIFTSLAAALWVVFPQLGPWPLVLALIPWVLRIQRTGRLALLNPLALPLWLFLLTAVSGLWAAYNPTASWAKFWLLVASFFLFYSLANQPLSNLWFIARLLGLLSVYIAGCFLLTHDWQADPTFIGALDRLAGRWMEIRPSVKAAVFHPNQAAGLIALLIPINIAVVGNGWHQWSTKARVITAVFAVYLSVAFFLTGSRGAWVALAAALALWGWSFISRRLAQLRNINQTVFFFGGLGLAFLVGIMVVTLSPTNLIDLANLLPGASSADSRATIFSNTLHLLGDFSFTGGGLDSFAGLYSQYILVVPQRIFTYAHNLYLDVALEQGILGLATVVVMLVGSFWLLGASTNQSENLEQLSLLKWAVAAGLLVLIGHGLFDDALYGNRATPLLLLLPGLTVALSREGFSNFRVSQKQWMGAGVLLLVIAANFLRPQWQAAWLANVGAVQMARVDLADWPTNKWDDGRNLAELQSAKRLFYQALEIYPANRTANHRLGMIAMLERDFETAVDHLGAAYQKDATHIGIRKSLAYSYVWNNQLDEAKLLLSSIPEAQSELEVYSWWWAEQDRIDLAEQAVQMLAQLEG
jgi:O-antigen ligase